MDAAADLSGFAKPQRDGSFEMDFAVQGITCAACIGKIEREVTRLPGSPEARLNYTTNRLRVTWREDAFRPGEVPRALAPLGYRARPFDLGAVASEDAAQMKRLIRCLAVAGFAAMNVMLLSVSVWAGNVSDIDPETRDLFHWVSALIALPAAIFAGQPFFSSAASALRSRQMNMDVPISVGIVLALGMSVVETARHAAHAYFDSALMLLFFLLIGRALDQGMRRKTRSIANNLASLRAPKATKLTPEAGLVDVPLSALKVGDTVLVRPGERFPADGVVATGTSEVDDSLITGETGQRPVAKGEAVYAGSLNFSGAVTVAVRAANAGTLLDETERLLENAASSKSSYVRLADRAARLYAPVVHLAALGTAIAWLIAGASLHDALVPAIAVLIITCPCALALAVPAVHVVASGALFRAGLLLRKGEAIERLAEIDTIVFDKTGTLTLPEPHVANRTEVPADMFELAARLALSSHHPLARSLAAEAAPLAPFENSGEEPGRGVRAVIDGEEARLGSCEFCDVVDGAAATVNDAGSSFIAFRHGARTAIFRLRQALRPDAIAVLAQLREAGFAIEILSGDNPEAVAEIARALGVAAASGGLKPAAKLAHLAFLKAEGRKVLMVGDGLNDAPALASAHVSLSPASAADVTQAVADAVFLGDRLSPVYAALVLSRRARQLMRENLWLAVAYNALAVPLAVAGLVTPLIAAIAMSGSSLLVTLNALRARAAGGIADSPRTEAGAATASASPGPAARLGLAS
jgi:Cu2+-exporting ATPase